VKFTASIKPRLLIGFTVMLLIILGLLALMNQGGFKIFATIVFIGAFIFVGNFLLDRFILSPLHQFILFSKQLTQNDLSQRIQLETNDEFEILARSLNEMLKNFRVILEENLEAAEQLAIAASEMFSMAEQINCATEEITDTMDHMAKVTTEQFEHVQLSVQATQQTAEIAQQVATEAQRAANYSLQASKRATNGEALLQQVHSKIMQLKETVDNSADVVGKLGARSLEIGKIVDVIRGISKQTNLLALNAAIEAARAGEHGRGFSVVADEVRALAEQSTNSAIQIVSMINEIQNESKVAVEAMEIGTKVVYEGTTLALSAKEEFSEITQSVSQTVSTIHEIAAASQEQAASSEEMTSTMQMVAAISKQNVSGANQVATATEEQRTNMEKLAEYSAQLVEKANQLTALVGRFKVKANFQRCWRVLDCNYVNCPAYQSKEEKCWLIPETLCQDGIPNGSVTSKQPMCHQCEVFKINMTLS
jgi:methyl-accepting chemotaxis protein